MSSRTLAKWSRNRALADRVDSRCFQATCAAIIILNALIIGAHTEGGMDSALKLPPEDDPSWYYVSNKVFAFVFAIETGIRMVAFRFEFFVGEDWRWNMFDLTLVLFSLMEEILTSAASLSSLRVLRGLRIAKVLRVIRVMRFFRDLRLMVYSIFQSLASLCWALLLLLLIMYLFSVCFMQGAAIYLREAPQAVTYEFRTGIERWFGSMDTSMYTLLLSITGGIDWGDVVHPIEEISMVYRYLYTFYVTFVVLGVLNVLTGIFVERACELGGLDRSLVIQAEVKRNETFVKEMTRIFQEADVDGSGSISWDEFKGYLQNDEVKAYFATQQLDAFDARTLFEIINESNTDEVSVEQFIASCLRLRGQAKSIDVVTLLRQQRDQNKRLRKFMTSIKDEISEIKHELCLAPPPNSGGLSRQSSGAGRRLEGGLTRNGSNVS